jgi:hypothetical protein
MEIQENNHELRRTDMVLGLFDGRPEAESAINALESEGYSTKDLSIIMKDTGQAAEIADDTGANVAEGATSGAVTGGLVGALAGLLIGVGAIAIPGIGGLLIGGPLAASLGLTGAAATTASGAVTGALAGGLIGALVGLGVPEDRARVYEDRVKEGAILLAVPTNSDMSFDRVRSIMEDNGADNVTDVRAD